MDPCSGTLNVKWYRKRSDFTQICGYLIIVLVNFETPSPTFRIRADYSNMKPPLHATAPYMTARAYWRRQLWGTGALAPLTFNTRIFFQSTLELLRVWQQLCAVASPKTLFTLLFRVITSAKEIYNRRCLCLSVWGINWWWWWCLLATLRKNLWTDLHEIIREGWQWASEQMIKLAATLRWFTAGGAIRIAVR